jgi:hypothetical protein
VHPLRLHRLLGLILRYTAVEPFRLAERFLFDRKIAAHRLERDPIFILGHWRSGTSYLQTLLGQDPDLATSTLYRSVFADISLVTEPWLKPILNRIARALRLPFSFQRQPLDLNIPAEADVGLCSLLSPYSYTWGHVFPTRLAEWMDRLVLHPTPEAAHGWLIHYDTFIPKLSLASGCRRIVMKTPGDTARVRLLLRRYPNAQFIYIHRDPIAVFHSSCYFWSVIRREFALQKISDSDVDDAVLATYSALLEAGGVDLVLGGHSHIYERSHLLDGATQTPSTSFGILDSGNGRLDEDGAYQKPSITGPNQGAVYVVAGHGGSSVSGSGGHPLIAFDEVANGSVILDLHANRLQITNIRYDGVVTDEVALVKGEALIVTSPDGGEHLESGTTHTVTWATVGNTPTVNVSWTCDEGQSWIDIATGIANTGSTNWTIPLVQSEHALVRVTSSSDANTWDESNGGFRTDVATTEQQAISYGATWSYHDQGVDLGGAWLDPAYNDSSWSAGPGQLGYGDGDEATLLQDADPNAPSAYFRHVFDIAGTVTAANLQALYDDGIAVWINATQVLGVNVDNGTDYSAWSSAQSSDNSVVEESLDLANNPFVEGQNVVAAMVKQRNGSSSDLSFDLSLSLTVRPSTSLQSCAEPEPEDTGSDTGSDTEAETGSDTTQETGEPTGDDTEEPKSGDRDATGALAKGGCGCSIPPPTPAWPVLILLAGLPWLRRGLLGACFRSKPCIFS